MNERRKRSLAVFDGWTHRRGAERAAEEKTSVKWMDVEEQRGNRDRNARNFMYLPHFDKNYHFRYSFSRGWMRSRGTRVNCSTYRRRNDFSTVLIARRVIRAVVRFRVCVSRLIYHRCCRRRRKIELRKRPGNLRTK